MTTPLNLKITNFKAIDHIDVDFNGKSLILLGKNGKGKSTFLQALQIAMGQADLPDNPVQWGKEKGMIKVSFDHDGDQYSVTVDFTNDKTSFIFKDKNGAPVKKSPKTVLKQMVGPTLDIFQLIEDSRTADGKRKMEQFFLEIANLDISKVEDYNKKIGANENDRLEIGRKRDLVKGVIDEYKDLDAAKYAEKKELKPLYDQFNVDLKAQEITEAEAYDKKEAALLGIKDKSDLLSKLAEIREKGIATKLEHDHHATTLTNSETLRLEIIGMEMKLKKLKDEHHIILSEIERQKEKIKALTPLDEIRAEYEKVELSIANIEKDNAKLTEDAQKQFDINIKDIKDANNIVKEKLTRELEQSVSAYESHNAEHAKVLVLNERKQEFDMYLDAYETLTGTIVNLREERRTYILSGRFPVPQMEYTESGIKYKNMPLDERVLSTSDIIELGVMLNDALNPNGLRFMPIPNASLFDKDHFGQVQKYLVKNNLVGAFEMVSSNSDDLQVVFLEE
jgi:DNA repair exonuclease SbcCD ATPase subunit